MNIAVFASHGGSDMQAIIDGCKSGQIKDRVAVMRTKNEDRKAMKRDIKEDIPHY